MSDSEDDQNGVPLLEDFPEPGTAEQPPSAKRKRDDEEKTESKRAAKRKKFKKAATLDDETLDLELGLNHAIAYMDGRLVADHIAQRTKRFRPDLSMLEAEELHISAQAITETSTWEKRRTTTNLADFLEHFAGPRRKEKGHKLSDAAQEKGSPHTLVVAGAGLRAADLTRALRKFQTKDSMVAKLFAKHIKLKEAIETVKKTRMGIGVGTPQRITDLLDDGALSSSHLERIVVDASHIDQKKRGILDMRETQAPLVQLLSRTEFKERYGAEDGKKIDLIFY
ncbi:hypothetical protein BAUCODRAFT_32456 [Baudoinia panamericana UAMH 10762]|uniref:Protein CMS1 n=1 Tax=Baudoinia panamericana (strain UAMH 10762) TaxID=717646 RepID=M2N385_BAUPA|nr:uncharacterized protein BAUCODRAFT_32456 [Baudoinia panamericana UAMH 10762]EMC98418.1 hypothetical protein BAUCODRAFT_32456 [Baudoinia panamericana UAMH 10762]